MIVKSNTLLLSFPLDAAVVCCGQHTVPFPRTPAAAPCAIVLQVTPTVVMLRRPRVCGQLVFALLLTYPLRGCWTDERLAWSQRAKRARPNPPATNCTLCFAYLLLPLPLPRPFRHKGWAWSACTAIPWFCSHNTDTKLKHP